MAAKLKLSPYTLKHYEPKLARYIFCNAVTSEFWDTDYITGSVIASLDGLQTREEIVEELSFNSPDVSKSEIAEHFNKVFDFLLEEGFIFDGD